MYKDVLHHVGACLSFEKEIAGHQGTSRRRVSLQARAASRCQPLQGLGSLAHDVAAIKMRGGATAVPWQT